MYIGFIICIIDNCLFLDFAICIIDNCLFLNYPFCIIDNRLFFNFAICVVDNYLFIDSVFFIICIIKSSLFFNFAICIVDNFFFIYCGYFIINTLYIIFNTDVIIYLLSINEAVFVCSYSFFIAVPYLSALALFSKGSGTLVVCFFCCSILIAFCSFAVRSDIS